MIRAAAAIVGAALLCAGCGSLNVRVDVLDGAHLSDTAENLWARAGLRFFLGQTDQQLARQRSELENDLESFYHSIAEAHRAKARASGVSKDDQTQWRLDADILDRDAKDAIKALLDPAFADFRVMNDRVRIEFNRLSVEDRVQTLKGTRPVDLPLAAEVNVRQVRGESLKTALRREMGSRVEKLKLDQLAARQPQLAARRQEIAKQQNKVEGEAQIVTWGTSIQDDPVAWIVAAAPPEAWHGPYNDARGGGRLGSLDVAIKLLKNGEFTIKGLSFDPSAVAQAASKVTTQSLLFAAQIAGVPVSTAPSDPQAAGAAAAKASANLSQQQTRVEKNQALIKDQKLALLQIAQSITSQRAVLDNDNAAATDVQKAITAIRATFDSQTTRLSLSDLAVPQ